jgi:hypothetical protein
MIIGAAAFIIVKTGSQLGRFRRLLKTVVGSFDGGSEFLHSVG